jgi:hypothetical protein
MRHFIIKRKIEPIENNINPEVDILFYQIVLKLVPNYSNKPTPH